ncbi:hypothetical protein [Nocardia salmonicida]|uniref:hypothetical protein n=1 Tax=Nocardia salmonicida TaxID=53431 RepID=UPI0007A3883D|nr:hypothetical protein [Nocardia salmonicida]
MATIRVTVPVELAAALSGLDGVESVEARRSSWQIAASVLSGATTTLALLQAPQTISDVAKRIHALLNGRKNEAPSISVEAVGPRGQLRIEFTDDTEVEEIAELLRRTVLDDEQT